MTDIEKAIEISRDTMYVAATGKYSYTPTIVENMCLQMATWKEQQLIEKAAKWLDDNQRAYREYDESGFYHEKSQHFIKDFKKAMNEE